MQKRQVCDVLRDLGVIEGEGEGGESRIPILELWNKWDLLAPEQRDELAATAKGDPDVLPLSATTGFGEDALLVRLGALLTEGARVHSFTVPARDGARIAWLHAHGEVLAEAEAGEGEAGPLRRLEVRLTEREFGRYAAL
jgi:GTP-binding protein HflX